MDNLFVGSANSLNVASRGNLSSF
jgi:uncharacterized phage infection (PIP) family protein YhgE